ncbi:MAG: 4Fe-4S binding protein [Deltaproteobacteria bacterium]|nr:MAG: 4Fe-4S binding protein [Deltaproteobacteria bacterium]
MSKKKALSAILLGLAVAVAAPLFLVHEAHEVRTHEIEFTAKKYGYSPARIIVNRGDTVVLRPTSLDVTHGFLLDGYDVEAVIKQQGLAYLKYTWTDDEGKAHTDWDKVREVEFTADKSGKFTFRCTQTCGNLHPFMTGELIVQDNTPYHVAVSLSVWLTLSLLLWAHTGSDSEIHRAWRVNLLEAVPLLKRAVKARSFQFLVIVPNLVFFYLFMLSGLWGSPVGNRNIAIIFVWILWWTLLKALMLPFGGRVWCLMCPLPAPGEWLSRKALTAVRYLNKPLRGLHHRFLGLNMDWPKKLRNIWLQNALFLVLISFGIILLTRPVATAIVFLVILAATLALPLIFRNRTFCLYLCPIGGFLGTYSMAACTELRAIDPKVCRNHKDKCCLVGGEGGWACPWGEYVGNMDRNNNCGLCTECIKSCPEDNVGVFLRPFGSDLNLRSFDEVFNVLIMLMVALVFSVTMLGPWDSIKQAANVTESRQVFLFLTYLGVVLGLTVVVFPSMFLLASKAAQILAGGRVMCRDIALRVAYIFIPLGMFVWVAFSLPQVMINYSYILSVLSDPLGLGWDLFGTAAYPFKPFHPETIPILQGVLVLAGLFFGLNRGFASLSALLTSRRETTRAMVIPSVLALVVVNVFLKLYMG